MRYKIDLSLDGDIRCKIYFSYCPAKLNIMNYWIKWHIFDLVFVGFGSHPERVGECTCLYFQPIPNVHVGNEVGLELISSLTSSSLTFPKVI